MKQWMIVAGLMLAVGMAGTAIAGDIDAPGPPSEGSGLYTLQNLYDYLTSGAALTVQTGFQEPAAEPGSTMKSTKEIGDAIKAILDQSDVTADDVALGKKFFSTQPGSWGIQTGKVCIAGTPTPTPTVTPTPTQTATPDPDFYTAYGPGGQDKVVRIGALYVAKWTNNEGTAFNGTKDWYTAMAWASALNWLGKEDWRLATGEYGELCNVVCPARASLGAYVEGARYWATEYDATHAWTVQFSSGCDPNWGNGNKAYQYYVRVVRDSD